MSRVTVKIYGQEYTLYGDRSETEIRNIAEHVDAQMKVVAKMTSDTSQGSLAVLASVNICEELFDASNRMKEIEEARQKIEAEQLYYKNMWEKSKLSTKQDKDDKDELKHRIKEDAARMQELREKCTEYESSFFDLQMENIKLKNELDKLKARI